MSYNIDGAVTKALMQCGELLVNSAKENITAQGLIGSGTLRQSIDYEVDGNELVVGTNLAYGLYNELGTGLFAVNGNGRKDVPWAYQTPDGEWHSTSGLHPKPWLQPALDENKQEITDIINEQIKGALNNG